MGYYTYYILDVYTIEGKEADVTNIDIWMSRQNNECGWTSYKFKSTNDPSEDRCKWYESDEDMFDLSSAFPDLVFTLTGWEEETGDHWKQYFKDGLIIAGEHLPKEMVWIGEERPPWLN